MREEDADDLEPVTKVQVTESKSEVSDAVVVEDASIMLPNSHGMSSV